MAWILSYKAKFITMKKLPILLILLSGIFLTSCGRSGWSCTKRYCNTPEKAEIKKETRLQNKKVTA